MAHEPAAHSLARKTFKFEFEITVDFDDIDTTWPGAMNATSQHRRALKALQQALVQDDAVLSEQMQARALSQLQEYVDYLAGQDELPFLIKATQKLEPDEKDFFEQHPDQFDSLTRPMRLSALSTWVEGASISEKVEDLEVGESGWRVVWRDLLHCTELGRLLKKLSFSQARPSTAGYPTCGHSLLVRYFTRQPDGVHMEAHCTCAAGFEEVGEDEDQALEALSRAFKHHLETCDPARRIQKGWASRRSSAYGKG